MRNKTEKEKDYILATVQDLCANFLYYSASITFFFTMFYIY